MKAGKIYLETKASCDLCHLFFSSQQLKLIKMMAMIRSETLVGLPKVDKYSLELHAWKIMAAFVAIISYSPT